MNKEYTVEILYTAKELTPVEKIRIKDLSNAISLDTEVKPDSKLSIKVHNYIELKVHNERSKSDKEYIKFVVIDTDGNKYQTGSESFWRSLTELYDDLNELDPNDVPPIIVFKKPSANFKDKYFLTCSI